MPNAIVRANAQTMPDDSRHLRARLAAAAERIIAALDALDAREEDLEDAHDAEAFADYAEPSLGSNDGPDQSKTWGSLNRAASVHGEDLEFEGDDVADCDREDGHDAEWDEAELSGIGDDDGYREQLVGEPSLGFADNLDQRLNEDDRSVSDAEATGTEDDFRSYLSPEARQANLTAARAESNKALARRYRRTGGKANGIRNVQFIGRA